jgi:hypothetical protein
MMVRWPLLLEGWREAHAWRHPLPQLLKDLAIAPFFGNSIACRLPGLVQVGEPAGAPVLLQQLACKC